jgi:hypothetical protein
VLVAGVLRSTTAPPGDGINVVERVTITLRLAFSNRYNQFEGGRRHADLFLHLADQCGLETLSGFDAVANGVPVVRSDFFGRRAQPKEDAAVVID